MITNLIMFIVFGVCVLAFLITFTTGKIPNNRIDKAMLLSTLILITAIATQNAIYYFNN